MQHQVMSFLRLAFKPTPTAILIGAPTERVPKNPKPIIPYLFQIRYTVGCLGLDSVTGLFLLKNARILSPKKAATNTPANPPVILARNIVHGERPKAKPAGMAAYISKVASAATVSIFKNMR